MFSFQPYRVGLINRSHFQNKNDFFVIFIIEIRPTSKLIMEIALERIRNCVNGCVDLRRLNLTELPHLPEGIIRLNCSFNQLTSLPRLPSTLEWLYCATNLLTSLPKLPPSLDYLQCDTNRLTSLPELPLSLRTIYCNKNNLTSLPELPPSLIILRCYKNQLTTLPKFPVYMFSINCYSNPLTTLPTLPLELEELTCHTCQLTSIPPLPSNLRRLNCLGNPLETLPELPSTLEDLKSELPWVHEEDVAYGGSMIYSGMYPDLVNGVNQMVGEAVVLTNRQSKKRCMERCSTYFEELMQNRWNPERVLHLLKMGYTPTDMY